MNRSLARRNIYKIFSFLFQYPEEDNHSLITAGQWQQRLGESLNMLDERYFEDSFENFRNECCTDRIPEQQEMASEYRRLFGETIPNNDFYDSYINDLMSVLPEKERAASEMSLNSVNGNSVGKKETAGIIFEKAELNIHKFEVMAILVEMESKAVCGERIRLEEVQMDFFSRFIVPSVPILCEEIIQTSDLDFYRTFGVLVREFVKFEANYLGIPEEMDTS